MRVDYPQDLRRRGLLLQRLVAFSDAFGQLPPRLGGLALKIGYELLRIGRCTVTRRLHERVFVGQSSRPDHTANGRSLTGFHEQHVLAVAVQALSGRAEKQVRRMVDGELHFGGRLCT